MSEAITPPQETDMIKFEVTIYEKAEHWTFETTVFAADETAARKQVAKDYPRKDYSLRCIQAVWSAPAA